MTGQPLAVILHGEIPADAPPDEQDTLTQAGEIASVLRTLGYRVGVEPVGLDLGRLHRLRALSPRIVVNLVESLGGQGRLLHLPAAVLETLSLPFTGSPGATLQLTTDKLLTKRLLRLAGLPTPELWEPGGRYPAGARFIVKAVFEDASIGLDAASVVAASEVPRHMAERQARLGGEWFAERFIEGREFNLPYLERPGAPELLPIGEMEFTDFPRDQPRIIGYAAKWDPDAIEYHTTPRTFLPRPGDGPLRAELDRLGRAVWDLVGLRGYARIDLRVDAAGRPFVLEANANPCLSQDAGFVHAAAEVGLDQAGIVQRLIDAALPAAAESEPIQRAVGR